MKKIGGMSLYGYIPGLTKLYIITLTCLYKKLPTSVPKRAHEMKYPAKIRLNISYNYFSSLTYAES